MASWSVGMQSNDRACEAIVSRDFLAVVAAIQCGSPREKKLFVRLVKNYRNGHGGVSSDGWSLAVLGMVEHLLDMGVPHLFFDSSRSIIDEALDREREDVMLGRWKHPKQRLRALTVLKNRLQGKRYDPAEVAASNDAAFVSVPRSAEARPEDP